MRLNAPMTLGLGGKRRTLSPGAALLNSADHYWDVDDWSGTGAWTDRNGGESATMTNALLVASGATYDTDKTASQKLIHLNGTNALIDLPIGASPVWDKSGDSTVLVGWKRDANGFVLVASDWTVDKGPGFRLYAGTSPATVADAGDGTTLVSPSRNGAALGAWQTSGVDLTATTLRHWTSAATATTSSIAALGTVQGGSAIRLGSRHYSVAYYKIQVRFIAIWQTSALSDADKAIIHSEMFA